jgi:hypothetical protein
MYIHKREIERCVLVRYSGKVGGTSVEGRLTTCDLSPKLDNALLGCVDGLVFTQVDPDVNIRSKIRTPWCLLVRKPSVHLPVCWATCCGHERQIGNFGTYKALKT